MLYSKLFIPTLREVPGDAVIESHRLMLRAAIMRKLSNGLFAYLPLGLRALRKLENIIRSEMERAGFTEIKPPVVAAGEHWQESGRWNTMGEGLLRFKNRTGQEFVISPTAEETFTALLRDDVSSYRQFPIALYQINTKYRDEIRPRYGVMRGREFIMKDAYSYHTTLESLDESYRAEDAAYRRIFERVGLTVIPVEADSGAMGGTGSCEFMVESTIGDNTLLLCPKCGYAANVEKAECKDADSPSTGNEGKIEKIATPSVRTIEELCAFLRTAPQNFIKTLIYEAGNIENAGKITEKAFYAVCIRGDLEVNEAKLAGIIHAGSVALALDSDVERITGAPVGFAGPVNLKSVPIIADFSVSTMKGGVCGANEKDAHFSNVQYGRDFSASTAADVRTARAGDLCAKCGEPLYEKKGNELGHIFKLGDKYTKSMKMTYLDEAGKARTPLMGCYGIGLDRTLASVIEGSHDAAGIIWPASLAPFHVSIVPIKYDGAVKDAADALAAKLEARGIEVLLDDRDERAGVKFNDADLLGFPYRVVIGDKNLVKTPPLMEIKARSEKEARTLPVDAVIEEICGGVCAG